MRGDTEIINSPADKEMAQLSNEKIIEMATISVRYDDAQYPAGYDTALKPGDDNFVEPIYRFEEEIDQAVLDKFGV